MALGLPVVASRTGGVPELVVDGKGGYLVNEDYPRDLATKILEILKNEKLSSEARAFNLEWSRRFDITHVGPEIQKLYELVITS
jgi:glycosyltransferase involved in cell wall biosynthesis